MQDMILFEYISSTYKLMPQALTRYGARMAHEAFRTHLEPEQARNLAQLHE